MLHVTDENRLVRGQMIFIQNFMNLLSLVPNSKVWPVQIFAKTGCGRLDREMIPMHRAQQKRAHTALPAKLKELARMRQFADRILHLFEPAVKPRLQLRQRHMREMSLIKNRE